MTIFCPSLVKFGVFLVKKCVNIIVILDENKCNFTKFSAPPHPAYTCIVVSSHFMHRAWIDISLKLAGLLVGYVFDQHTNFQNVRAQVTHERVAQNLFREKKPVFPPQNEGQNGQAGCIILCQCIVLGLSHGGGAKTIDWRLWCASKRFRATLPCATCMKRKLVCRPKILGWKSAPLFKTITD